MVRSDTYIKLTYVRKVECHESFERLVRNENWRENCHINKKLLKTLTFITEEEITSDKGHITGNRA